MKHTRIAPLPEPQEELLEVTSIIRYIYIVHENWIHNKIPNFKHQCIVAHAALIVFLLALMGPPFGYSFSIGNIF